MERKNGGQIGFLLEMADRQISAREFFSNVLLDSIQRNFGLKSVLIYCFDTKNNFLSWTDSNGIHINSEDHPYMGFAANDVVGNKVYHDAVRDKLTYSNVKPRLYRSTDIISPIDYDCSAYVRFLEENFGAHYSTTLAMGINACIRMVILKRFDDGDFTAKEMDELSKIYVYIANSYKNFKKHEQTRIISNIQDEIISSNEKAYLITDDFMHVMCCNNIAMDYLKNIFGVSVEEHTRTNRPCTWLPFLLGESEQATNASHVQTRIIKGYIFKIYTYDQGYSHGMVDRYHWITISESDPYKLADQRMKKLSLTQTELKVAELLYKGLTYQAIANELVISYHTAKNHVHSIYEKCGVRSRFELYKLLKELE